MMAGRGDLDFSWDPEKAIANFRKHGITFDLATEVFVEPFPLVEETTRWEHGERRWRITGRVAADVLTVVFTIRDGQVRLISARKASRNERRELGAR
ncbi:MAG: BrnT family toxin [Thermomicrobiales bacterium]|nr:BrnT family toxin [Thermomicrobiales bacterium]